MVSCAYSIGFFHIDLAEVRTAEGKLSLFVAIDRTSKFAVVKLVEKGDVRAAVAFLETLVEAAPYRIHTVLTDNGIQFADLPKNRQGQLRAFVAIPSTGSAIFMKSNTGSPSPTTLGPTGRSSA